MFMNLISGLFVLAICLLRSPMAPAQARHTNFDPARHGFNFHNDFENDVKLPAGLDVRTGGLCGGVADASLDYFLADRPIPRHDYRPVGNTPLPEPRNRPDRTSPRRAAQNSAS